MVIDIESLEDSTKLTGINKLSKEAGYKINAEKFVVFLYANNEPRKF